MELLDSQSFPVVGDHPLFESHFQPLSSRKWSLLGSGPAGITDALTADRVLSEVTMIATQCATPLRALIKHHPNGVEATSTELLHIHCIQVLQAVEVFATELVNQGA